MIRIHPAVTHRQVMAMVSKYDAIALIVGNRRYLRQSNEGRLKVPTRRRQFKPGQLPDGPEAA